MQTFQEQHVCVPYCCRGAAVCEAFTVTQWPIMVGACMIVRRVQGVGFELVALWIPLRGFFAQGQGYSAVSRAQSLQGLLLVLPDAVIDDRQEAKNFLKDVFQPRLDAINTLKGMQAHSPATVTVATGGRDVQYAMVWDCSRTYSRPTEWVGIWIILLMPREETYTLHSMTPDHFPN